MSINAEITLKRLVYEISVWAEAHDMIESFGYGKYLETFATDETRKYPVFVVNCPNYSQDQWYFNYNLELICLEWVFDDRGNRVPAASDTAKIISDFENTIRESNRWQSFSRIDAPFNCRKVDEFGADKADGWVTTFTLKVKKTSGICNLQELLPTYDFENQTPVLGCQDVTSSFNGTTTESTPSGSNKAVTVQTDEGVPVETGTLIVDTATQMTIEVVAPGVVPLNTANTFKTGATSYYAQDDGAEQNGRGFDVDTLDFENWFGNTDRITDKLGTQIYADGIALMWDSLNQVDETVKAIPITPEGNNNLKSHCDNQPFTKDGHSDWELLNVDQLWSICRKGIFRAFLNYPPFNLDTSQVINRVWSSTWENGSNGFFLSNVGISVSNQTATNKAFITRNYTKAELGL